MSCDNMSTFLALYGGRSTIREVPNKQQLLREDFAKAEARVLVCNVGPQCMAASAWFISEMRKQREADRTIIGDAVLCEAVSRYRGVASDDAFDSLRYVAGDHGTELWINGIRDDVENGVKVRQWQPAKGEAPLRIGVDQKQRAKNRAARKAAKKHKKNGRNS